MAEYGVRYRNAANILQIDGTHKNMQMVQKGVAVPNQNTPGATGFDYPVTYATLSFSGLSNPVLAIRCTDPAFVVSANRGGGVYDFWLYRTRAGTANIEWWLFDDAKPSGLAPGWGQRVRNRTTGEVVYDTRIPPFRVTDQIYPFNMPLNGGTDFSYSAGKKYAYSQIRIATRVTVTGASTVAILWEYSMCKATAGGINISWQSPQVWVGNAGSTPPGYDPYNSNLTAWIVVDVTDL